MFYWFVLALLATWRVTQLLARESGPWNVLGRLRGGAGKVLRRELLSCFNCLSIWVALPFTLVVSHSLGTFLVSWLALSGGAVLLDRFARDPLQVLAAADEERHELL